MTLPRPVTQQRATLPRMDHERILARVCEVIEEQGGDWDATEAVLRDTYDGAELRMALDTYAPPLLWAYEVRGGPAFLRAMRDHYRRLVPAAPAPRGRWRAAG